MPKSRGRKHEARHKPSRFKVSSKTANDPIVIKVLNEIITTGLVAPMYRSDVLTEEDADAKSEDLPIIFVWNEKALPGGSYTFSCSVNGVKVARLLEVHLDRSDPRFVQCRDEIMGVLGKTVPEAVRSMCEKAGRPPSQICIGDWY